MFNEIFYTNKNIKETKLALISDIHFNDKYNRKIFTKILKQISNNKPNYITIAGDILDTSNTMVKRLNENYTNLSMNTPQGFKFPEYSKFKNMDNYFEELLKFWDRMMDGGRKSFRYDELDSNFFLKETPGVFIPYLEALQKDLEQR